jgi:hypothetical protein
LSQAPEHSAHELAARQLRVEHAPRREHPDHPPDPHEPDVRIDGDLGELRTERQQAVRCVERWRRPAAQCLDDRLPVALHHHGAGLTASEAVPARDAPVAHLDRRWVGPVQGRAWIRDLQGDYLVVQRRCRGVHCGAHHARARRPDRRRGVRQVRVARFEPHRAQREAEAVGGDLRHGRQDSGPELLGTGLDDGAAVGVEPCPCVLGRHEQRHRVRGGGHAGADQPVAVMA